MKGYGPETYGERWSEYYDEVYKPDESIVDLLSRHAGEPPRALELAIGSGRIALPLAERGVEVSGIDASPEMVAKMRAKPGGGAISVTMGDFADVAIEGQYPLIYLAFNTLFALLSQERQIECFQNVADHLLPDGRFIIDCFVPDVKRYDSYNTRTAVSEIISVDEHTFEMSIYNPVHQTIDSHMVRRTESGESVVLPVAIRFAWPAELDLMARLAGLELEDRFGWYDLRPFNEQSTSHMSIYRKPD